MNQTVKISCGKVVGIGKVKIPRTTELDYDIPMLSFLIFEGVDGGFVSSCVHLKIDGYGAAGDVAVDNMIDSINSFLKSNISKLPADDAWQHLMEFGHIEDDTIKLWNTYRGFQFGLAAIESLAHSNSV
ncbi:MAG: hypothetical protein FWB78_12255 [Treponema sp.]|nr:hypothetical protein [Treponema sp.]